MWIGIQTMGVICGDDAPPPAGVENVDWDTDNGRYRVRLNGQWIIVPDSALITEPNRYGPAVVWPYRDADGTTQIRCFLPGAGA